MTGSKQKTGECQLKEEEIMKTGNLWMIPNDQKSIKTIATTEN